MNGIGSWKPCLRAWARSSDRRRFALASARCSGLSKVRVDWLDRIQLDPLLVSRPCRLLTSIRYRPPGGGHQQVDLVAVSE